jgi:7-cyano-7-deazaguanine synthase in queuosine biosynthesis
MSRKILVLLSGGLDSSVMLMKLRETSEVAAIFFDRGQSNGRSERAAASKIAASYGKCHLDEIDIGTWWASTERKVSMIDVPRNAIFALLASPFAMIQGCDQIALGSTLADAKTGDSNKNFVAAFNQFVDVMKLERMPELIAPLLDLDWDKKSVATWARQKLGEEFIDLTHSCWKEIRCGKCPACVARADALGASSTS